MKITKALADLERSKLSELQHCDDPISIDSLYSMIKVRTPDLSAK